MDEIIRQAIADLSAPAKGADDADARRIRAIIERLRGLDAHGEHAARLYQGLRG